MKYSFFLLSFLLLAPFLWAQKLEFEHLSDQDGLSNSNVASIVRDADGYMWFATFNGLSRYDGYQFTNFLHDPSDNRSVCGNRIWGLLESQDDLLYVTTPYDGFCIYDKQTETFTKYAYDARNPSGLSSNMVMSIFEDKKGRIWIGTPVSLDLFDREKKTFTHYYPFGKDIPNYVAGISGDEQGNLWIYGHSNRLCKFNPDLGTFDYLKFSDNPHAHEIYNHWGLVHYDKKGNLWVGNRLEGLYRIDPKTGKSERYSVENKKLASNVLMSIKEDQAGNIWICTDGAGLYQYSYATNSFSHFQHDPEDATSLGSNAVYCFYESEPGLYWVGTYAAGLHILKKNKQKFLKFDAHGAPGKKLLQKSVLAIAEADNGNVWLATDGGGLHLFDPNTYEFKNYTEQNGKVASNVITCLLRDHKKNLWCGTYRRGMFRIDESTGKIERFDVNGTGGKKLFSNNVYSFCESKDGKIWIGYVGAGVERYDPATGLITRPLLDTIAHGAFAKSSVFKIIEDSKKRIWFGSENSGTVCYDPAKNVFRYFAFDINRKESIGSNDVRDILEDASGTIWLASGKGGLCKLLDFEKGNFENYTTVDGLPSNHVLNILEDDHNRLWLSTDKGITLFDPPTKKFTNFDAEDGVQTGRFNNNSRLKTSGGFMYFGGIEGFNFFHPDSVHINEVKPSVKLTGFSIFNHWLKSNEEWEGKIYLHSSIPQSKSIELTYHDNVFSIEFAALSFISPQSNQYAYKLEGFDQDWTYVNASKRFATYTNLDPGTYTFQVIASNNDGVWNETGASMVITVLPPWWETWWFKAVLVLAVVAGVLLYNYLKTRSIHKRNKFLEEEVKIRTADLLKSNEEILLKNKILEKNNLEISKKTERILEQQEEILKQKSEVEQLNKTKDKFFSIIAHDLKNPVTALSILIKGLRKEIKQTTNTGKEMLSHVELSSERIKTLTYNLLEWTKTQNGNIKVKPERLSVHKLIEENIQLHSSQTSQKQLTVTEQKDPSLFILADYNMVNTIIRNIMSNAIKYTPKGGHIEIAYYSDEGEVIISFKDNGIGMEEDLLDHLFGNGLKASVSGTENETGTGIGLTIAKEFSILNNGDVYAESNLGEGSTFYLCLPATEAEHLSETELIRNYPYEPETLSKELASPDLVTIKEQFNGKKILLVDDDLLVLDSIKLILKDVFEIFEAPDVKTAFELSEKISPDLIISDVTMPGESGIQLCNRVKQNWITSHIPIILLTAQSSHDSHLEGLLAGADAYITKPFDRNILISTVNNLLSFLENSKLRFSSDTEILPAKYMRNKLDEEVLSKAIRFIEQTISDPDLNGDMLCKELGISKTVLYTKLKTITGQTVNEFIRTIRLKKSIGLLIEGRMNVTQISAEMGFNSASYYTKSFTAHFGFSPKEYVNLQLNKN